MNKSLTPKQKIALLRNIYNTPLLDEGGSYSAPIWKMNRRYKEVIETMCERFHIPVIKIPEYEGNDLGREYESFQVMQYYLDYIKENF